MSLFGRSWGRKITGRATLHGSEVDLSTVSRAIDAGLAYVTEDRKQLGLLLADDVRKNITLANLDSVASGRVIDDIKELRVASDYRNRMRIRCSDVYQTSGNLSGGNQQKVVLSKWLFTDPDILILDEPTRGIDIGAKYEIYCIINELADAGKAVIVISSEMPELLGICDRICVMNEGAFVGEFDRAEATQEKIMRVIVRKGEGWWTDTWKKTGREVVGRGPSMSDKTVTLPDEQKHAGFLKANLREYGMLLSLLAIMLFFQVVTDGTLLRPLNLTNLVLQNSYIVIMALGMLLVIVTGHIDLSVGSVAGFIGAIAAVLMVRYEMHFIPATIVCLALGALIGAAQGYWVAYFKIPSFIVTLAGMLVFKGLALAVLQGQSVGPFSPTFQKLSSGFIPEMFPGAGALYPTSLADRRGDGARSGLCQRQDPRPARQPWRRGRAHRLLCVQERGPVRRGHVFHLSDRLASRPAQRAGDHDRADRALWLRHRAHHHRPADLCGRRQREGGKALRHQDRAADLPHLRQHGRAGGARRAWCSPRGSTPQRRRPASASNSTSSPPASSAAPRPMAASERWPVR